MPDDALVLLVEDCEDDVFLIKQALAQANAGITLYVVNDGEEAVEYLSGIGPYSKRAEFPLPALVLLDLKMANVDGFLVLKWIRSQAGLKPLRVVVVTSSDDPADTGLAYQLGANSVVAKPAAFERLVAVTKGISGYWLGMDRAPRAVRPDAASALDLVGS
jgi:CheY-like chemotaxis protein